jgi:hypothetical protein
LADRYAVSSPTALFAAHDLRIHAHPGGPFAYGAAIETGGLAALGGSISVTVQPDGSVRWAGHASGADGYDFSIAAVLRGASGQAIALAHSGHVGGTFTPGDRDHDWDETRPPTEGVSAHVADYANARLETHLEYTGDIGSTLEAAVAWLVKSAAGTLLGPVGIVVFVGVEIGSLISTGSLVPGARLAEGILWMAGPANTMFAIAAEGIASLGSRTRQLTQEEYDWANREVFEGALPPRDKLVLTDTIGGGNRAFTFPRYDGKITLNMGPAAFDDPRNYPGFTGAIYIHELVHACQIDHAGSDLGLLCDALSTKVCEATGESPYTYGPAGTEYGAFSIEQQAQIVQDWFSGTMCGNQTGIQKDINSPYFRYIQDNLRVGRFS